MAEKDNCECEEKTSPDHCCEIPKINRIIGQLEGIKRMIDDGRYCPDILIQLMAVRSATRSVAGNILKCHLQSCVVKSFTSEKERLEKIEEIKSLFDKFEG